MNRPILPGHRTDRDSPRSLTTLFRKHVMGQKIEPRTGSKKALALQAAQEERDLFKHGDPSLRVEEPPPRGYYNVDLGGRKLHRNVHRLKLTHHKTKRVRGRKRRTLKVRRRV